VHELIRITRALADSSRVRVLLALRGRELCVCQFTELFGLAFSTISRHLAILHHAGLVVSRKQERWVYYRLPNTKAAPVVVREALDWVNKALASSPEARADGARLKQILRMDPSKLCQKLCSK
jgi:DNA-binding transcriptional ArsR family regulator